ncbi:Altered inheritance of mitochondria protein 23, mitochondrial, partial [Frankliniella fusca]
YWDDQRTAVKKRAARVRNHLAGTEGGRPLDLLSDYDRRVLALMGGWTRVVGFTSVVDPLEISPIARGITPGHSIRRSVGTPSPRPVHNNRWGRVYQEVENIPPRPVHNNRWGRGTTLETHRLSHSVVLISMV